MDRIVLNDEFETDIFDEFNMVAIFVCYNLFIHKSDLKLKNMTYESIFNLLNI